MLIIKSVRHSIQLNAFKIIDRNTFKKKKHMLAWQPVFSLFLLFF